MLHTDVNEFLAEVNGSATITANASANTKGSANQILAAASVTEDIYAIEVNATRTNTAAQAVSFLVDILYDPAGGTNWQTLISNLVFVQPTQTRSGYRYYFPLFVPKGSSFAAQCQSSTGGATIVVALRCYQKPTRPDLLKVGTKVQTIGDNTATSRGTTITPGNAAYGSYTASLGTLNFDAWWWQVGLSINDTTMAGGSVFLEVAVNATNKLTCLRDVAVNTDTGELVGKSAFGAHPPIRKAKAGENVYARAAASGTPDSAQSVVVYAVG